MQWGAIFVVQEFYNRHNLMATSLAHVCLSLCMCMCQIVVGLTVTLKHTRALCHEHYTKFDRAVQNLSL